MKTTIVSISILALLLTTAVFAQRGQGEPRQGRGQGMHQGAQAQAQPRASAPASPASMQHQGPPPGRGPGMGQGLQQGQRQGQGMRGLNTRPGTPPPSMNQGPAMRRPPVGRGPAYNQGHQGYRVPPPRYGRPYGYGYPYPYPSVGFGYGPYGWTLGGVFGGITVFYETQIVEQSTSTPAEVTGPAFLTFEVDAVSANVYVDGDYVGVVEHFMTTPLELPAGKHTIEFRLNGKKVGTFKVCPSVGQTVRIRAKLIE